MPDPSPQFIRFKRSGLRGRAALWSGGAGAGRSLSGPISVFSCRLGNLIVLANVRSKGKGSACEGKGESATQEVRLPAKPAGCGRSPAGTTRQIDAKERSAPLGCLGCDRLRVGCAMRWRWHRYRCIRNLQCSGIRPGAGAKTGCTQSHEYPRGEDRPRDCFDLRAGAAETR